MGERCSTSSESSRRRSWEGCVKSPRLAAVARRMASSSSTSGGCNSLIDSARDSACNCIATSSLGRLSASGQNCFKFLASKLSRSWRSSSNTSSEDEPNSASPSRWNLSGSSLDAISVIRGKCLLVCCNILCISSINMASWSFVYLEFPWVFLKSYFFFFFTLFSGGLESGHNHSSSSLSFSIFNLGIFSCLENSLR